MAGLGAASTNTIPDPEPAGRGLITADAPALLPLLDQHPRIRIYTRSSPHFRGLAKVLASHTEATPLALVRPVSEDEIAATVLTCTDAGLLPLAVRGGGNDMADRNYVGDGVVVDMRLMDSVVVSADRRSARVGGGVVLGRLLEVLDAQGLDTPCGWGHQIGYVGWACGGGYGCEAGLRGMGADQILAGRIVAADGTVVVAGPGPTDDDRDAYWALRGAPAGILGVVSELTVRVYPKPKVLGGQVVFPFSEVGAVLASFERLYAESYPDKFSGDTFVMNPPDTGGLVIQFFWWLLDDDESDLPQAQAYLERIRQCGTVVADTVAQTTPYNFLYAIQNPVIEERQYITTASCTVAGFSSKLGGVLSRHPLPTPLSCVVLHTCHGAGSRQDDGAAFANRTPHVLVGASASCPYADETTRHSIADWPHELLADIVEAGLALPLKYVNFNPREPGDGMMYLGEQGLARMRAIKERLDPRNVFAVNTPDMSG